MKYSTSMVSILERIHFENPTDIDVTRLQSIIENNNLIPADIKYRFSKLYNWQIKIVNGKLVLGYKVRFKRPNIAAAFTCNHMIVFESMNRFILQDKNGVMHGCEKKNEKDEKGWITSGVPTLYYGLPV